MPVRGYYSSDYWDKAILVTSIISFLLLTFFVFDNSRLLRWFINEALGKKPSWKSQSKEMFVDKNSLAGEEMDYWMLIRLVAQRSEVVNRLIFYPFIIWLMLFISRWNYFDNWTHPTGFGHSHLPERHFYLELRHHAQSSGRKITHSRLLTASPMDLIHLESASPPDAARQSQVKSIIEEVKTISQGAFTPFFQNPVVQALFVPFGGVGGLTLLDFFNKLS